MSKRGLSESGRCLFGEAARRWHGLILVVLLGCTVQSFADVTVSSEEGLAPVQTSRHLLALTDSSTGCNEWGGKTLEYLDRHAVECGPSTDAKFLNAWHSTGCGGGNQQIDYKCASVDWGFDSSSCVDLDTGGNEIGGKDMAYLDRHDINCPAGKALKRWHLSGDRIWYKCCDIPGYQPLDCYEWRTQCDLKGNLEYFDRYRLNCGGDGRVMTRWAFKQCGGGPTRFDFRCCKLQPESPSPPPPAPPPPTATCETCTSCAGRYGYKGLCS